MITENLKNSRLDKVNLVRYGAERDRQVLHDIASLGALTTEQVSALHFTHLRPARKCLRRLVDKKMVSCCRLYLDTPNIYYVGKRSGRIEHLVSLNWAYVWFRNRLMSGQSLYYWKREIDYKVLQTDALVGLKVPGDIRWYFIEMDRAVSHNEFDKVEKYNEFYSAQTNLNLWWVNKARVFPKIIVITEDEQRKQFIEELVRDPLKNVNGLHFDVKLLSAVKWEAKNRTPDKSLIQSPTKDQLNPTSD